MLNLINKYIILIKERRDIINQIKVGKFIAKCRKEKGLTQESLAEKLGITYKAVSKWECEKSLPDASKISHIFTLSLLLIINFINIFNYKIEEVLSKPEFILMITISLIYFIAYTSIFDKE